MSVKQPCSTSAGYFKQKNQSNCRSLGKKFLPWQDNEAFSHSNPIFLFTMGIFTLLSSSTRRWENVEILKLQDFGM